MQEQKYPAFFRSVASQVDGSRNKMDSVRFIFRKAKTAFASFRGPNLVFLQLCSACSKTPNAAIPVLGCQLHNREILSTVFSSPSNLFTEPLSLQMPCPSPEYWWSLAVFLKCTSEITSLPYLVCVRAVTLYFRMCVTKEHRIIQYDLVRGDEQC